MPLLTRIHACHISAALLSLLFSTAALPAAAQAPDLSTLAIVVSHTPAGADNLAQVSIRIPAYGPQTGITAYQFALPLPPGVEFVGLVSRGTLSSGGFLGANTDAEGVLRVAYAGAAPSGTTDAPLLLLDLRIVSGQGGSLTPERFILNTTENHAVQPGSVYPHPPATPVVVESVHATFPDPVALRILMPDLGAWEVTRLDLRVLFDSRRMRFDSVSTSGTQARGASIVVATAGDTLRIAAASSVPMEGVAPLLRLHFTPIANPVGRTDLPVSLLDIGFNEVGRDLPGADPTRLIAGRLVLDPDPLTPAEPDAALLFSEVLTGSGSNAAIELFNASATPAVLRQPGFPGWLVLRLDAPNGARTWADHATVIPFPEGAVLPPHKTFVLAHPSADPAVTAVASALSDAVATRGGPALALVFDRDGDGLYTPASDRMLDVVGSTDAAPGHVLPDDVALTRLGPSLTATSGTSSTEPVFDPLQWIAHPAAPVRYLGSNGFVARIEGGPGYRLLAMPASAATAADLLDDVPLQGVPGGPDAGADPNLLLYGATRRLQPPASLTTPFAAAEGFALYLFDNEQAGSRPLPLALQVEGPEPEAPVVLTLNTEEAIAAAPGLPGSYFTLAGNPYASGFDLSAITPLDGDGLHTHVQVWSAEQGTYLPLELSPGQVVAPWQGFWLETTATGSPTTRVTFRSEGRVSAHGAPRYLSREAPAASAPDHAADQGLLEPGHPRLDFHLRSATTHDRAIRLDVHALATDGYDRFDAAKLVPLRPDHAVLAFRGPEGRLKSVESRPIPTDTPMGIPLELIATGVRGPFTLQWEGLHTIPDAWGLTLTDRLTGRTVALRDAPSMTFSGANTPSDPSTPSAGAAPHASLPAFSAPMSGNSSLERKESSPARFILTIDPLAGAVGTSSTPGPGRSDGDSGAPPREVALRPAYPNPFNPTTRIRFDLPVASHVRLEIRDMLGRRVATLHDDTLPAGRHSAEWNAASLASGVYFCRLTVPGHTFTRTLTLIR